MSVFNLVVRVRLTVCSVQVRNCHIFALVVTEAQGPPVCRGIGYDELDRCFCVCMGRKGNGRVRGCNSELITRKSGYICNYIC